MNWLILLIQTLIRPRPNPLFNCPTCDFGTLAIGDLLCQTCREGDYIVWCDENNIPEGDR